MCAYMSLCPLCMCVINSWDVGNAHFVILSTEVYFYTEYGVSLIGEQYNWLEQDLKVCVAIPYTVEPLYNRHFWTNFFSHFLLQCRSFRLPEVKNVIVTSVGTKIFVKFFLLCP